VITSAQLTDANAQLTSVARNLDDLVDKHGTVHGRVSTTTSQRGHHWRSPAGDRWTTDAQALLAIAGEVPPSLAEAAAATRSLATSAASLASELASYEVALTSAEATAQSLSRQRASVDPDDADRLRSLTYQTQDALTAQRLARQAIERCAERWTTACRSAFGVVQGAVAFLSAVATPPGNVAPDGRPDPTGGGSPFGGAIDAGSALLGSTAVRGALHGHGVWLFTQRAGALREMARAWVLRGYLRSTEDLRAVAAGARSFATLRWGQIGPSMDASRAATAARVASQTERIASASDVFVHGRGVVRTVGRVAAPVAAVGDASTLIAGSQYDGGRGTADQAMAGVGLASTATLVLAGTAVAAGTVIASPVIVTAAVIGATAATVWGVGNLIYDHRESIGNAFSSAGSAIASAGSAVASGASNVVASVGSGFTGGVRSVGRVFGFGG
jgi:hypothetical protein